MLMYLWLFPTTHPQVFTSGTRSIQLWGSVLVTLFIVEHIGVSPRVSFGAVAGMILHGDS